MSSHQKVNLRVDWCSHAAAKWACENWHYSKTIPKGRINAVGVWENDKYIGCVVFGHGATNRPAMSVGCTQWEACELQRVALTNHLTPVTRIVAIAIKMMQRHTPGLVCVVSYADPAQGHIGGIYQGGNWIYTGLTEGGTEYFWNGEWVHSRTIGHKSKELGISRGELAQDKRRVPGKHRYAYPLTDTMREQIEPLRKPYPKRALVAEDTASNSQLEGGGVESDPGAPQRNEAA